MDTEGRRRAVSTCGRGGWEEGGLHLVVLYEDGELVDGLELDKLELHALAKHARLELELLLRRDALCVGKVEAEAIAEELDRLRSSLVVSRRVEAQ